MIYENVLLEALKVCNGKKIQRDNRKNDKYWRKIIKLELKRIRKGHMTCPWLNSAMRYWKDVNKWEDITKESNSPKQGDICSKCGIGKLKKQPTGYHLVFGSCFHELECDYCETEFKWTRKEISEMIKKEIKGDENEY